MQLLGFFQSCCHGVIYCAPPRTLLHSNKLKKINTKSSLSTHSRTLQPNIVPVGSARASDTLSVHTAQDQVLYVGQKLTWGVRNTGFRHRLSILHKTRFFMWVRNSHEGSETRASDTVCPYCTRPGYFCGSETHMRGQKHGLQTPSVHTAQDQVIFVGQKLTWGVRNTGFRHRLSILHKTRFFLWVRNSHEGSETRASRATWCVFLTAAKILDWCSGLNYFFQGIMEPYLDYT